MSGFWLVTVDRRTGAAATLQLIADRQTAYQEALDIESLDDNLATVVVRRKES